MAWTSKGDRCTALSSTTAGQHIGPGHYKLTPAISVSDHGYAPFGSTDPKAAASNDGRASTGACQGPPPGSYDPKIPGKYDPGLPRKSVPFGVGSTRIDLRQSAKPKTDFRPGPGTYKVDADLPAAQGSRTMGIVPDVKSMLKSYSAPSIPQSHQAYGYEEVGGGRLVRQGPKDGSLFCSGRPGDSAGPGQYQPVDEVLKPRQINGAFLKGPARISMGALGAGDQPGPGHYPPKSCMEITSNSYVGGAAFASGSDRLTKHRDNEQPGPGQYAQNSRPKPDLREIRSELQYFGSTVERFKTTAKAPVPTHIGPGHYTQLLRRPEPPNPRGFCITEERFKGEREVPGVLKPGPGQYEIPGISEDTMSGPLATFSMLGNSGGLAFGAMSKRLKYAASTGPEPGDYKMPGMSDDAEEDEQARRSPQASQTDSKWRSKKVGKLRIPASSFASKTPKDVTTKMGIKEGAQKPPPGAYDAVLVKDQGTVVRLRSKNEGFLMSSVDRFKGGPLDPPTGYKIDTGPGKYGNPADSTGGKRLGTFNRSICEGMPESGRPKGLGFEVQDKRFSRTSYESKGPGPGSYSTEPGWITKSHNCYFGDVT